MDVRELELNIMQNKSVTLESFELQDFLAEKFFHINKGVKIANNLSELKESFSVFASHLDSFNQRLRVISEVLNEWNTELHPSFVSEYGKIFEYLKEFEDDTLDSKTEITDYLERIEELNDTDF